MYFTFILTYNEVYNSYFSDLFFNINHKFRIVLRKIQGCYLQVHKKSQGVVLILKSTKFCQQNT